MGREPSGLRSPGRRPLGYGGGPDRIDRFWPGVDRLPAEAIGIQRAQPEEALRGDRGEKQMSQIGP